MGSNELRALLNELESLDVSGPEDWDRVQEWRDRVSTYLGATSPPDALRFDSLDSHPQWYYRLVTSPTDTSIEERVDVEERESNVKAAVTAKAALADFLNSLLSAADSPTAASIPSLPSTATPKEIRKAILFALYDSHHSEPHGGIAWRTLVESLGISEVQFHAAMSYLSEHGLAERRSNIRCRITASGIDEVENWRQTDSLGPTNWNPPSSPSDKSEVELVGSQVSLEILEQVDSGLYGKVFRARQVELDRIVAVKIIKPEFSHVTDAVGHAKALARVGLHPNIVAVHDVQHILIEGVALPAMVMEWIDGEKFGVRLAGQRFSEQELRRISSGVLDGMERMHAAGMQHGDLHFGNVILLADCHPKIIDIDATRNCSLGRLSDVSRDGAIAADVDYCRQLVYRASAHSVLSASVVAAMDSELQSANSLEEIRSVLGRALGAPRALNREWKPRVFGTAETAESLAAKVQEYIEARRPASLFSLIMGQASILRDELLSDRFSVHSRIITPEIVQDRLARYQQCVGPLLPALATGCYWGDESHWNTWKQCIETVANCYEDLGIEGRAGITVLLDLRNYPTLLLHYAAALGAFLNDRTSTLRFLTESLEYVDSRRRRPLGEELLYWRIEQGQIWDQLVLKSRTKHHTPVSDHLSHLCYGALRSFSPVRSTFETQFDRFEYFLGLMRCPDRSDAESRDIHAPVGSYIWRQAEESGFSQFFLARARERRDEWEPFKAGLFGRRIDVLERIIGLFDEYVDAQRDAFHIRR